MNNFILNLKCLGAFCLALTAVASANPMCLSLCGSCAGKSDSTCTRVDSLCSCTMLLDSVRTADSLHNSYKITAQQKLSDYLLKDCKMNSCSYKVTLKNGIVQGIHSAECPLLEKELIADSAVVKDSAASPLQTEPAMKPECADLCSKCPTRDSPAQVVKSKKQKSKKTAVSEDTAFCAKLESACRCSFFAQRKLELVQRAKADSISKMKASLTRIVNADSAAVILASHCDTLSICSLLVTLRGSDLKAIDLRVIPAAALAAVPAADLSAGQPKTDSALKPDSAGVVPPEVVISQKEPPVAEDFMDGIFYGGPSIAFGLFKQHGYGSLDIEGDQGVHASAGFFLRWYFYRYGSFETGLNGVFHYMSYEDESSIRNMLVDVDLSYKNAAVEMPFEIRIGVPFVFLSYAFEIRKPIYEWGDVTYYSSLLDYEVTDSSDGFFDDAGFEFGHWLGAGLDIRHRVTVEFQYLLGCFKSGDAFDDYGTGIDETWKVKLEVSL